MELTVEQKQTAVVDLASREGPAREVAEKHKVFRVTLYRWKNELLGKEYPVTKRGRGKPKGIDGSDVEALRAEVESLREEKRILEKAVYRLRLENDVLRVTAEILRKTRAPTPRN